MLSRRELETEIVGLSTLTVRIRKGQAIMNNFIGNEQRISGTKALKRDGPSGPTLFRRSQFQNKELLLIVLPCLNYLTETHLAQAISGRTVFPCWAEY